MSVSQILLILWRRSWIVALAFVTTMIVAAGVLLFVPGRYDAVASATIDPGSVDPVTATTNAGETMVALMQGNILALVQSERVALDVVRRLNLTASQQVQENFRQSSSFGRESIENWMAASIIKNVDPKFTMGTNVLLIKYKSGDPNQAALIANAFLSATIDAMVAMKAASGDQTARWFDPQIDELRKQIDASRNALTAFQAQTNVVAPSTGGDSETNALLTITQTLTSAKANLAVLKNRLASGATDPSVDPSDPDLQLLGSLKEKLSEAEAALAAVRNTLGSNNPKMVSASANVSSLRRQISEATERMREHLRERIAQTERLLPLLEAQQADAQKKLIAVQAQRDKLGELERDLAFHIDQLNTRQRMAAQARLQSKLTFADIAVLDKATPPIEPAFPKPLIVIPVGIGAGLALGLLLALIAEATDRRIRFPGDLEFATSRPLLGVIKIGNGRRRLRSA